MISLADLPIHDPIILVVAAFLVLLSVFTWTVFLVHSLKLTSWYWYKSKHLSIWHKKHLLLADAIVSDTLSDKDFIKRFGVYGRIALFGKRAKAEFIKQNKEVHITLSEYLQSQLVIVVNHHHNAKMLTLLASIAASAPFIGLFGTVWGIYLALISMANTENLSLSNITPQIAEALLITGLGLAVAVPALLMYNALARIYQKQKSDLSYFAQQWHNYLVSNVIQAKL